VVTRKCWGGGGTPRRRPPQSVRRAEVPRRANPPAGTPGTKGSSTISNREGGIYEPGRHVSEPLVLFPAITKRSPESESRPLFGKRAVAVVRCLLSRGDKKVVDGHAKARYRRVHGVVRCDEIDWVQERRHAGGDIADPR
jgi:hypothetical protein